MNKLPKEKRDKLILTILGAAGVAGILYTFVLGAQRDRLATLQAQILSVREKLSKAERLNRNGDGIELSLNQNRALIDVREESMAPQGQYYYWFLKLLDQFRHESRFETSFIVDITQPEFIEAGLLPQFPYKAASFGVRLNGHYQDIGKFVADLENRFPYFRVQNVRMSPQNAGIMTGPGTQLASGEAETDGQLIAEVRVIALIKPGTT